MDPSSLDASHGASFSFEVRSRFGLPVCSLSPDDASSFWLVVAFSRSKLRLSADSVGAILQSVIGGSADLFSVVELEQQLFKFSVINRVVGLHVYGLKSFSCDSFKLFFQLWNPSGLAQARISAASDSGPRYEWVQKRPRKTGKSYAAVVKSSGFDSVSRARVDTRPSDRGSVFSRLNFSSVPDLNLQPQSGPGSSARRPFGRKEAGNQVVLISN
jgi:hypothetical protein